MAFLSYRPAPRLRERARQEVGAATDLDVSERRLVDTYLLECRTNGVELHGDEKRVFQEFVGKLVDAKNHYRYVGWRWRLGGDRWQPGRRYTNSRAIRKLRRLHNVLIQPTFAINVATLSHSISFVIILSSTRFSVPDISWIFSVKKFTGNECIVK